MMYRKQQDIIHINILFDEGGVGDAIARLPAIQYILDNHPHVILHLWLGDYFVDFAKRALKFHKNIIVKGFSEKHKYKEFLGRAFGIHKYLNLASHMTSHAFHVLCNYEPRNEEMNYLPMDVSDIDISKFNLPDKYVVVCTGFTSDVREFLPKHVNEISGYLLQKGYIPVFLGKEETTTGKGKDAIKGYFKEEILYDKGINLINKTSLLETTKIIHNSKTIVGLDNGLIHIAATSDIPIVVGFTTVLSRHRLPYRKDLIGWNCYPVELTKEELACRGCQSLWHFTYEHRFDSCFYKDKMCTQLLTSDKYIKELEKIL